VKQIFRRGKESLKWKVDKASVKKGGKNAKALTELVSVEKNSLQ